MLQYIHSNEYVHADINAENIYVKAGDKSQVRNVKALRHQLLKFDENEMKSCCFSFFFFGQVYLVEYYHAFRYCPGGKHVEYREASKTPHEGTIEFISLDAHKGAGKSPHTDFYFFNFFLNRANKQNSCQPSVTPALLPQSICLHSYA